eukprot:364870-Chlamydomonas_euryale.AAC.3
MACCTSAMRFDCCFIALISHTERGCKACGRNAPKRLEAGLRPPCWGSTLPAAARHLQTTARTQKNCNASTLISSI